MRHFPAALFAFAALTAGQLTGCDVPPTPPFRLSGLAIDTGGENLTCIVTNVSDETIVPTEIRFFLLPATGDTPVPLTPNPQRVVLSEPIAPWESGVITVSLADLFFVVPRETFRVSGFHVRSVDVGRSVWSDRSGRFSYPDTVLGR
ncbi:MAG: hypothetical protein EA426_03940 [Spirochaetaceae bacterium]|nr:MAG: hypothetical protein EA426_03940 [Spirochaetaceae bacterium]